MSQPTLLPCPFCGSKSASIIDNGIGDFFVFCGDGETVCGARTSDRRCELPQTAADRWNRRAPLFPEGSYTDHTLERRLEAATSDGPSIPRLGIQGTDRHAVPLTSKEAGKLLVLLQRAGDVVTHAFDAGEIYGRRFAASAPVHPDTAALEKAQQKIDTLERIIENRDRQLQEAVRERREFDEQARTARSHLALCILNFGGSFGISRTVLMDIPDVILSRNDEHEDGGIRYTAHIRRASSPAGEAPNAV